MKLIPSGGNDEIDTPFDLAIKIVTYFNPKGKILEPCKGNDGFYRTGIFTDWCEIKDGKDFFDYNEKVDWIITNPPFSKFRKFLNHSMELADNIVFLCSINHFWLKARIRDMIEKGFGIKEILLVDTPETFPQSGFQIGVVHIQKGLDFKKID